MNAGTNGPPDGVCFESAETSVFSKEKDRFAEQNDCKSIFYLAKQTKDHLNQKKLCKILPLGKEEILILRIKDPLYIPNLESGLPSVK